MKGYSVGALGNTKQKVLSGSLHHKMEPGSVKYLKQVWDEADYVVPPAENGAFFVTTNLLVTSNQTWGQCPEVVFPLNSSSCLFLSSRFDLTQCLRILMRCRQPGATLINDTLLHRASALPAKVLRKVSFCWSLMEQRREYVICLTLHTAQCTVRFCLIINSEEKPTSSYWLKVTDRRQADVFPMTSQDPLAMTLFVKYNRGRLLLKSCTKSFIGNITYNIQNIWIPKKILFSIILKGLNLKSY